MVEKETPETAEVIAHRYGGEREALRAAVAAMGGPFRRADLMAWIERHFPAADPLRVEGFITAGTVNDRRRQHFPAPDDLLFRWPDGTYERWVPSIHGWWSKAGWVKAMAPIPQGDQLQIPGLRMTGSGRPAA